MCNIRKLALVAGEGQLPVEIINQCKKQHIETLILRASEQFSLPEEPHITMNLGDLKPTIELLKKQNFQNLMFAGRIDSSALFQHYEHLREQPLQSNKVVSLGDNSYYAGIVHFVERLGFKVFGIQELLTNAIAQKGLLTKTKPSEECFKDIALGVAIERKVSELDIGQSIIIANRYVLGIEAIEGTDNLIKRCAPFIPNPKSGVLVKIKKKNQEKRIDLPVIGENTIKNAHKANLAGIALEAGSSIIINKERVIEMADQLGLFIIGI